MLLLLGIRSVDLITNNPGLLAAIKQEVRVRADDDRMYPVDRLCYPRDRSRSVFGEQLRVPHAIYFGQSAPSSDPQNWIWFRFFAKLGFHVEQEEHGFADPTVEISRPSRCQS